MRDPGTDITRKKWSAMAHVHRLEITELEELCDSSHDAGTVLMKGGFDDAAMKRDPTDSNSTCEQIGSEQVSSEGQVDRQGTRCVPAAAIDIGRDSETSQIEVRVYQDVGCERIKLLVRKWSEKEQVPGKPCRRHTESLLTLETGELVRVRRNRGASPVPECDGVAHVIRMRVRRQDEADIVGCSAGIGECSSN